VKPRPVAGVMARRTRAGEEKRLPDSQLTPRPVTTLTAANTAAVVSTAATRNCARADTLRSSRAHATAMNIAPARAGIFNVAASAHRAIPARGRPWIATVTPVRRSPAINTSL
jgi:hypothetical protein